MVELEIEIDENVLVLLKIQKVLYFFFYQCFIYFYFICFFAYFLPMLFD